MMGIRVFENGWSVRIGPAYFRWFRGVGGRLRISFCGGFPIRLFGFNQRTFHLFWQEENVWN